MKRAIFIIALVVAGVFFLLTLEDKFVVWSNGIRYNVPQNMEWSPQVEKEIAARQLREAIASTRPTTAPSTFPVLPPATGSASPAAH